MAPPPTQRAGYYRWLFFGAGTLEYALVDKMLGRPAPERTGALGYGSFADALRTIEAAVTQGPWLLGETFSAADVYVGSQIAFATMMKGLEPTPALVAYAARCRERPALQRAQALDTALAA